MLIAMLPVSLIFGGNPTFSFSADISSLDFSTFKHPLPPLPPPPPKKMFYVIIFCEVKHYRCKKRHPNSLALRETIKLKGTNLFISNSDKNLDRFSDFYRKNETQHLNSSYYLRPATLAMRKRFKIAMPNPISRSSD